MIEKERKVILTKSEYALLNQVFEWDEINTQTNYYYMDKENILEQKGITVRVREKNGLTKLQVKLPMSEENSLHIHKEYEKEIDDIPQSIQGYQLKKLVKKEFDDVYLIGHLVTLRKTAHWNDEITICLDKNEYLNLADYELEIEFLNYIDDKIYQILDVNYINYSNKVNGKYKRFLYAYKHTEVKHEIQI